MALIVYFVADEQTARITPDALRLRLEQSGMPVRSQANYDGEVELETENVLLWLWVEDGYVVEMECQMKFVNDGRAEKVMELLGSMGWIEAEE